MLPAEKGNEPAIVSNTLRNYGKKGTTQTNSWVTKCRHISYIFHIMQHSTVIYKYIHIKSIKSVAMVVQLEE